MPKKSRVGKQFQERLIAPSEPQQIEPAPESSFWKYGFVLRREQSDYLDELVISVFLRKKKKLERSAIVRAVIELLRSEQVDISDCSTEQEVLEALRRQLVARESEKDE